MGIFSHLATHHASSLERTRRELVALDRRLLRQAVRGHSPEADKVMRATSTAANKSRLWMGTAAVVAVAGGRPGRRAALRGLLAIGITSAVVNGPLKLLLRRARPAADILGRRAGLVVRPKSSSFPSGHAASAVAFATSVAREWPVAGIPVAGAAAAVAYSRVYTGVHFPSDVLVGAGLGVAAATAAGYLLRDDPGIALPKPEPDPIPKQAILFASPNSKSAQQLGAAKAALQSFGIEIVGQLDIEHRDELAAVVARPDRDRPLVIAAGGDGTVGAAADQLAGTSAILAILPLGTSNDVARSLGISPDPVAAAHQIANGVVRAIDAGQLLVSGSKPRNFVHAATVGFNVHFAELATKSSLRRRFGRFTYAIAGLKAMNSTEPFECELTYDGTTEKVNLVQLSIINAPVFGGHLDLRVPKARLDDRSLVIIAVEQTGAVRLMLGMLLTVVARRSEAGGIRALRTKELKVHVERPLDVALDGEISATLPADFEVSAQALRVVTPRLKHHRA